MNIKIEANLDGNEILDIFRTKLSENNIDHSKGSLKITVINKSGEPIEISPEKLKISYNN